VYVSIGTGEVKAGLPSVKLLHWVQDVALPPGLKLPFVHIEQLGFEFGVGCMMLPGKAVTVKVGRVQVPLVSGE
jgi:hypothetical protein